MKIGKLFEAALKTAVSLPIAIVKDAATLGGVCTDQNKPYTAQIVEDIENDIDEVGDE